ncbi:DUF6221 family protein [Streptomyces aquilus]|uniref:DUF6221 family protein n=1 Tax=Streptomyces aquilus TaxID=2548456 RepID=UPI0037D52C86
MTSAEDMLVWLRAAMDTAEQLAQAAAERAWSPHWEWDHCVREIRDLNNANELANIWHREVGNFVEANDPAAVLRRIAADRKLLAECVAAFDWDNWGATSLAESTIRHVAEGYGWTEETACPTPS